MMEEGGVTVCVRVRPLIARENEDLVDEKGQVSWKSEDCTVSQIDGTKSFVFDRVFHSNNSTKEVYQGVTAHIIKSAVQGYNGTIFAYGQTASGKTYTILGNKDGPGILPMAINDVFNTICRIPDREFLLRVSYMEIHNETIQDLLCSNIRKKKSLVVREDINRTIYVEDLNEEVVVSPEEVMSWLKKGEKNRHYGETKMNERSSRSHTIFRMIIESKEKHTSGSSYEGAVMVSHLNFVDLAGSERASQTGAEGIRLKEGCNINRSLFILGQVIKKLCDDQSGGFINYRDSKLTRILQNSLGGNAKTVIICTITPASLEETLGTLQFASTAKKMKNSPKVNEVLNDDALLKRYRNEIEDLKRQLEEVSSHCHTKDQLAQLLEEKNSVQKEQQDRIRALTEMLVTASSFLQERELKAKKKRRVTWAPGAVSQDGGMAFLEDFPSRPKRFKTSLSCVSEMEESVSSEFSEYDDQCMTASIIMPEEEWIPGSERNFTPKDFTESFQLCQSLVEERDNAITEQQTIKAKLDSVCLEKERLVHELTELHEKMSTHEFVTLEKLTSEEQEMQLMHEITNLKVIISNAEIYNQDLQQEINSKDMQCKEQEERITALEEHNKKLESLVEELKKDKNDTTILVQTPRKNRDEVQELRQSLRDAEAIALDARKESAFLRSENLTLKEKMNQLSDTYKQMEKDFGSYKTQLEAGKVIYKKMQSDLQKELQYYLQENAKLTSLVENNNSKDLLPYMELEGKMEDLKNELNKALEENVSLKEKLTDLSEANSGSDLEILHKEIVEKNETIALLMSEKEMLLSQVGEKVKMVHEATQEKFMKQLAWKMDVANDEVIRGNTVAFEELRQPCDKLEQKSLVVAEEDKSMKTQIDSCSSGSLNASISYDTQEQSSKNEELQEKDLEQEELVTLQEQLDEAHQKLSEMEKLKDQLKVWEFKMEDEEAQKSDMMERLQEEKEKIRALTQERNDFKQKQEALEKERDQLKEDIQDTVSMNIEAQEGFRNAQNSLKQCQKHIKELEETVAEKDKQISRVKETLEITTDDQKQQILQILQILKLTGNLKDVSVNKTQNEEDANQIVLEVNNELQRIKEQITTLQQEKVALQHQLEDLEKEKNQYLESNQMLQVKSFDLQQLLQTNQNAENFDDSEQLKISLESQVEALQKEKAELVQKLHSTEEDIKYIGQEKEHLRTEVEILQAEKDTMTQTVHHLGETLKKLIPTNLELQEQLRVANNSLSEYKKMVEELKGKTVTPDSQISKIDEELKQKAEDAQLELEKLLAYAKLQEDEVNTQKNLVQKLQEEFKEETKKLKEKIQHLENNSHELQQLLCLKEEESQQNVDNTKNAEQLESISESQMEALQREKAELVQKVQSTEENIKYISQEKEHLRTEMEVLQTKKDNMIQTVHHLSVTIERLVPVNLELQQELREANNSLREHKEMVEELKEKIVSTDFQTLKIHEELKKKSKDSQLELEKLLMYVKSQEDEIIKSNEEVNSLTEEKKQLTDELRKQEKCVQQLLKEKALFQKERDDLQQVMQNIREETQSQLQDTLSENAAKIKKLNEEVSSLIKEKKQLTDELREQEKCVQQLLKEKALLQEERDDLHRFMQNIREETQSQLQDTLSENAAKIKKLNEEANSLIEEKKQLTDELSEQAKCVQQLLKEKALLQEERDDLQRVMQNIREETQSQLQDTLSENAAKIKKLNEEVSSLIKEKKQLTTELREQEKCVQQLLKEKALLQEERDDLHRFMQNIREETQSQLQDTLSENAAKIKKLNEEANSLIEEKKQLTDELSEQEKCVQQLLKEKALLQEERDDLQRVMQNIREETQSQLQDTLSENAAKIKKLNEEVSSLIKEKKQLTDELREQEKCVQQLLKEKALLQEGRDDLHRFMQNIREETQSQLQDTLSENAAQIKKLNEEANSLIEEKKQLTDELREQEKCVQQLLKEKALLQEERDDLQRVMQNIREETQSQLQDTLSENTAQDSEMNIKRKTQDCFEILEAKIFQIMEALKKFPELEKRSEYFIKISLQIKNQFDSKKAIIAQWLPDISPQEANNIKRLQTEDHRISNSLYNLLNKLQYLFSCLCNKRKEFYINVSRYTRELLDERKHLHAQLMQIQKLGKPYLKQQGAGSQLSGLSGLMQSLDGLTEQISKEVSEMEEDLGSTEVMLQELERKNIEVEQYLERCSYVDLQGFEATIKQNIEKFQSINQFLRPKAQPYFQATSELDAINADYCREIDATLKACREERKELILQLDMLEKDQKSCGVANMSLEENHNLRYKLEATEQDTKNLQLKIQELESIINEGTKNLQEKEKTIAILEMKLKVKASRNEVIKLQAALEDKENCLRNALSEREALKAQMDKGVGLYKEEIEGLRTQLVKADMARTKQSKWFDREMANAKALADHREEQLRKLKEELRKAQQEQDATVMFNEDPPQPFQPITCGGGSGIIQNTHVLVLKSKHAKLEKECTQLKKEHELLLTNEHLLKEEVKKWKERAMKRRERALGDTVEEHKIKSPRKAPASSLLAVPASPCKERSMQPILPLDTPQPMPSNSQSIFFDDSCLGIIANTTSGRTESEENNINWLSSEDKDVSNCKTQ